jgi:hypothetical protein
MNIKDVFVLVRGADIESIEGVKQPLRMLLLF